MVMFVFIFGCLCHDKMHRQLVGVTRDVSPSPGLLDLVTCIQLTLFSFRLAASHFVLWVVPVLWDAVC